MICSWFLGNSGDLGSRNIPQIYTYHAVVTMSGTLVFSSNIGGGLSINQGLLNVAGQVLFSNNIAFNGGGLKLIDRAEVRANCNHVCCCAWRRKKIAVKWVLF